MNTIQLTNVATGFKLAVKLVEMLGIATMNAGEPVTVVSVETPAGCRNATVKFVSNDSTFFLSAEELYSGKEIYFIQAEWNADPVEVSQDYVYSGTYLKLIPIEV